MIHKLRRNFYNIQMFVIIPSHVGTRIVKSHQGRRNDRLHFFLNNGASVLLGCFPQLWKTIPYPSFPPPPAIPGSVFMGSLSNVFIFSLWVPAVTVAKGVTRRYCVRCMDQLTQLPGFASESINWN